MLLEVFIRYETDIVGLERTLRLVQALIQIVTSYPLLLELLVTVLGGWGTAGADGEKRALVLARHVQVMAGVRLQLNLARRFFRVFRFAESFYGAHQLFGELVGLGGVTKTEDQDGQNEKKSDKDEAKTDKANKATLALWLTAFSRAFMGMHLLLEVLTLPDVLGIDGLAYWGPAATAQLTTESLRTWFVALACSTAASLVQLARVVQDEPLPQETHEPQESPLVGGAGESEKGKDGSLEKHEALQKEQARLRRIVRARLDQRRVWRRRLRARAGRLIRRALADGIDMILPGNSLGWTPVQAGTAGLAMLTTTLLTGAEAWERCVAEVAAKKES